MYQYKDFKEIKGEIKECMNKAIHENLFFKCNNNNNNWSFSIHKLNLKRNSHRFSTIQFLKICLYTVHPWEEYGDFLKTF